MGDARLALRNFRKRPGYALACVTVLALGIGACTSVFSVLYSAALKPLPYPHPERVVVIRNRFPEMTVGASPADFSDLTAHTDLFAQTGAYYFLDLSRGGMDVPQKVNAVAISSSLFDVLGVKPLVGRTFNEAEQKYRGPHAVILSEEYWRNAFAGDAEILHRSLKLNGEIFPVIGVMSKTFAFPNDVTQMWVPIALRDPSDDRNSYLRMYARLVPGISSDQASARMAALSRQVAAQNPRTRQGWKYLLTPMVRTDDSVRRWLWILFGAVACFLLIVSANVAGLVLVRSLERQSEMAIRAALGASRWRIARQVLAEVALLACAGGIGGLAIAAGGIAVSARYAPIPTSLEPVVFWFSAGISLLTGLLCGIFPALRSANESIGAARERSAGRRLQRVLIVTEVGVATALVICGGLLVRSLIRVLEEPLGFDADNVATMTISLPGRNYSTPESRALFFDTVLEQTAAIPGVESAGACTLLPFGYGENKNTFEIVGRPAPAVAPYADLSLVTANYFDALRIPLRSGRAFGNEDRFGGALAVIVDESFAQRFLANESPLGRQLKMPWRDELYTIVGVTGAVKVSGLELAASPTIYFSAEQAPVTDMTLAIRTRLPVNEVARHVQRIAAKIDPDQPVYDVAPLEARIDRTLKTRRFVVWLMLSFAAAGTGLAALGLYGLLAYTVTLRRREIGIRMALGANRGDVAMLVCREAMMLVFSGVAAGSIGSAAALRWIASQLYGVGIADRVTWLATFATFAAVGLIACAAPTWRAVRTNPAEAMKTT